MKFDLKMLVLPFILFTIFNVITSFDLKHKYNNLQTQIEQLQNDSDNQKKQIANQTEQLVLLNKFVVITTEIFKEQQKINESLLKGNQYGL